MLFSVITVTFNAERYLAETLQSVSNQRRIEFEHIIWDGGSRDHTLDIVRNFSHVTLLEGSDRGIADAMNRAASYARGDFLLFLHADDLFAQADSLLMVKKALQLHPHVDWIYGRAHIIDEEGVRLRTTPYEPYSYKRLRKYNFFTHPANLVRRSLFHKIGGFHAELRYCMDYDLWLRLARFTQPFALGSAIACFRQHKNSLSTNEPISVTDEAYDVRNRYVTSLYERYLSYCTWKKRRKKFLQNESH